MRVGARLAAFGAVLLLAFALGVGLGAAVGPLDPPGDPGEHHLPSQPVPDSRSGP